MGTPLIIALVTAAVLVFWAVGAHNRLSAERDRLVRRFIEADRVLRVRRKTLLAWVASAIETAPAAAKVDMSGGLEGGLSSDPTADPAEDFVRKCEAVLHACTQADAASEKARVRPTSKGLLGSLNMAEQVLERTLRDFMAHPQAIESPARRAAWVATEVQLSVARQLFNREADIYNRAVTQFPANMVAGITGLGATAALEAGANLSPASALSPATLMRVPTELVPSSWELPQAITRDSSVARAMDLALASPQGRAQLGAIDASDPAMDGRDPASRASAPRPNPVAAPQVPALADSGFGVGLETAVLAATVARVAMVTTPSAELEPVPSNIDEGLTTAEAEGQQPQQRPAPSAST